MAGWQCSSSTRPKSRSNKIRGRASSSLWPRTKCALSKCWWWWQGSSPSAGCLISSYSSLQCVYSPWPFEHPVFHVSMINFQNNNIIWTDFPLLPVRNPQLPLLLIGFTYWLRIEPLSGQNKVNRKITT